MNKIMDFFNKVEGKMNYIINDNDVVSSNNYFKCGKLVGCLPCCCAHARMHHAVAHTLILCILLWYTTGVLQHGERMGP